VAGVVDQVGAGVTEFQVGDDVLGSSLTPSFPETVLAFPETVLADPANLIAKPADISWKVAGSLAGGGGSAWAVLKQLDIRAGETLLVHAAAGHSAGSQGRLGVDRSILVSNANRLC
jgi:NADPH:quinone reductase-like Zn-dependent oxidoreductase